MIEAARGDRRRHRKLNRAATILRIAAATVVCAVALAAAASSASATIGNFCPSSGSIGLQAYSTPGDRCVWVYHTDVTAIGYKNMYPNNAESCAVLKPNSDGSGGDVGVAANCPNNDGPAEVQFSSPTAGYATGINHSPNYHTGFQGWLALYS